MGKIKCFGCSLLPVVMWMLIQIMVAAGFTVTAGFAGGILAGMGAETAGFAAYLEKDYLNIMSVVIDMVVLVPGYFWFQSLRQQEIRGREVYAEFSWKVWIRLFFLGIALQMGTSIFLTMLQSVFPEVMKTHFDVLESLGMFSPTFFSILYVTVMAPVAEELLFRGITLKILEKAFPFWTANLLQALYFGIIHGNPVQGIYAFFMGVLLGKVVKKYGTLKAAIFCHFVINLSGVFLSNI